MEPKIAWLPELAKLDVGTGPGERLFRNQEYPWKSIPWLLDVHSQVEKMEA